MRPASRHPTLTRRAVLGASALALGGRAVAADADVAIVGAGAAGLAAGKRLRALGRTFVVLEARNRVGGRIFTDDRLGPAFDAGAQYIHWADRNPWTGVAAGLGVATEADTFGSPPLIFTGGRPQPDAERSRRGRAFMLLDGLVARGAVPDRSIADSVRAEGEDMLAAAAGLTRLTLGEEPERVSAADYDQLWSGDDLVMREGYGTLVRRYGGDIPVRLAAPVRAIDWSGQGVAIETASGALRARAAIVTVPVGILQAETIAFRPALPLATLSALDGLGMGAYTKIALRIDRARVDLARLADAIDLETDRAATSFEIAPFGRDLVIAYCGGDFARELCRAGEREAVAHATERLGAIFGSDAARAVTGGVLAGWWTDPLARGAYSVARPGRLPSRLALRDPIGQRIWLAGEASAGGGAMTGGGAFLEGERAAEEVARSLRD